MNTELPRLPITSIAAGVLRVAYHASGPSDGQDVILLHGYPYDIHSFVDVVPLLAERGFRVYAPHLRGHGETTFLSDSTPRSGQQAALGQDLLAFIDAIGARRPIVAGFDWGARAASVAAVADPEHVGALVTVGSYLIQDIASSRTPIRPDLEAGFWYFWYFATERGLRGLMANRAEIARVLWTRNSPDWRFGDDILERTAKAFENPDYVEVVIHSYRHRLGLVEGVPEYGALERRLATQPPIPVPAVTLDGLADGNFPATDAVATAHLFSAERVHRHVPHAGHNLPAESPLAFADAISEASALIERSGRHG